MSRKTEATKTDLTFSQLVSLLPMVAYIGQSSFAYGKTEDLLLSFGVGVAAYVGMWVGIGTVKLAGWGFARLMKLAGRGRARLFRTANLARA